MAEKHSAEAILFFDDHEIIKEMTYAEFQAILDNYVPLHDIAKRQMLAVYTRINSSLNITAAVFFKIAFDQTGFVEKSWNIPLQQLADYASKGPNLGSGPIALACYSQCPIDWQQNSLWDPTMQASQNDFVQLKKHIKNNALGLIFEKKPEQEPDRYDEERTRAALLIKEQRLKQKLISAKAEQDMRRMRLDHQERVMTFQNQLNEYQQQVNELRAQNLEMKESLAGQSDKINGMRDYYEHKLQLTAQSDTSEQQALEEHYESELLLQAEALASEFNAQLQSKDVELLYRSEREAKLKQELLQLQQENKKLIEGANDAILNRLSDAGVNFITYHPGAGHFNIQAAEVELYLHNPTAFVAQQCGVNEQLYRQWLDHYYTPSCQHGLANGETCDKPIESVAEPRQFVIGESDCCPEHRKQSHSVVNINKHGLREVSSSGSS